MQSASESANVTQVGLSAPLTNHGSGTGEKKSELTEFLVKLSICVSLTVSLLLLGELAAYVKLQSRPPRPPDSHLTESIYRGKEWAPKFWHEWKEADKLQYRSYVVWHRAPYTGQTVVVDKDGLRRTFYSQCDSTAYTIWMFGDSALWGTGAPDWETIPSLLAKQYAQRGSKVCVKNYGEIAWVTTQEVIQLMLDLKYASKRPDLVLFYDGTTDAFLPYQSDETDVHGNFPIIKQQFEHATEERREGFDYLRRTNTFLALESIAQRIGLRGDASPKERITKEQAASMAQKTFTNMVKNAELVDALASRYAFRYIFFEHPTVLVGQKPLTPEEKELSLREEFEHPGSGMICRALYELFRTARIPHLYYLADLFDHRTETLYADFAHLGPEGNQLVAEQPDDNV